MRILTRGDKILILLILIISSLPLLALKDRNSMDQKQIVVNIDGNIVQKFNINEGDESEYHKFYIIKEGKEYEAKLETKQGKVRLLRLSEEIAPLSIHADTGWIEKSHQMIVALPAKLIITVEDSNNGLSEEDIDIISY